MEVHVGMEWWLTVLGVGVSERRAKVDRVAPAKPTTSKIRQTKAADDNASVKN